jgi:hypothetical protein
MSKQVRAKFNCTRVEEHKSGDHVYAHRVMLNPVYSDAPESENRAFWTATPSGQLDMYISNQQAWGFFVPGQEYYLDFAPVETAEPETDA